MRTFRDEFTVRKGERTGDLLPEDSEVSDGPHSLVDRIFVLSILYWSKPIFKFSQILNGEKIPTDANQLL